MTDQRPMDFEYAGDGQGEAQMFETVIVEIATLKRHPKNYREHPPEQIEHLKRSIREHGFYRNVVVARDDTILAGHGVVAAARHLGLKTMPVIRLAIDPDTPAAL